MSLDAQDEQIVTLLVDDAPRSSADFGTVVGLSASVVQRRVDRMRADRAVTGFTGRLDAAMGAHGIRLSPPLVVTPGVLARPLDVLAEVVG